MRLTTFVPGVFNTFLLNHRHVIFLTPIFVPLPKKCDVTNAQTTAPLCNFLMQIRSSWDFSNTTWDVQIVWNANRTSWFKKNVWVKGANFQIKWIMDSGKKVQKMSNSFIENTKNFNKVQHLEMWNSLGNMGIPKHLTVLTWDLHTD